MATTIKARKTDYTNAAQQLIVAGNATLDMGDGTGSLTFADSSAQAWSGSLNLTGTFSATTVRFGTSATALTPEQLGLLRVNGQRRWLSLGAGGYLVERKGTFFSVL